MTIKRRHFTCTLCTIRTIHHLHTQQKKQPRDVSQVYVIMIVTERSGSVRSKTLYWQASCSCQATFPAVLV